MSSLDELPALREERVECTRRQRDALTELKRIALEAVRDGERLPDIARAAGVSQVALSGWISEADDTPHLTLVVDEAS